MLSWVCLCSSNISAESSLLSNDDACTGSSRVLFGHWELSIDASGGHRLREGFTVVVFADAAEVSDVSCWIDEFLGSCRVQRRSSWREQSSLSLDTLSIDWNLLWSGQACHTKLERVLVQDDFIVILNRDVLDWVSKVDCVNSVSGLDHLNWP